MNNHHESAGNSGSSAGTRRILRVAGGILCLGLAVAAARAQTPPVPRSLDFNGSYSNIVFYPAQPWMNTNVIHLTVEAWIYPRRLDLNQALVARALSTNLWFGLSSNRLRFARSGGAWVESTGTVPLRRWSHVAATYDGLTARFYINGQLAGQSPLTHAGNNSTNSLSLGGQRDLLTLGDLFANWGYPFDGLMDEVRLWMAARTQSEIQSGMYTELRFDPWLLAAFGEGGLKEDTRNLTGECRGLAPSQRLSGFGILPDLLCVPWTSRPLTVDGVIEPLAEYIGAETVVLKAGAGGTVYDLPAYLIRSVNASNNHLFIGIPNLPQGIGGSNPVMQVRAALAPGGDAFELGDWEIRFRENTLQGATRFSPAEPPFFPVPYWKAWGQSPTSWTGATAGVVGGEFLQNYEFRIHAGHLNDFDKYARLLLRYGELGPGEPEMVAPPVGITNHPATYAVALWCGEAVSGTQPRVFGGTYVERLGGVGPAPSNLVVSVYSGHSETTGILLGRTNTDANGFYTLYHPAVPTNRPVTLTYDPPAGPVVLLPPLLHTGRPVPVSVVNSPYSVTYPPTALTNVDAYCVTRFLYGVYGPITVTGASPTNLETRVLVRAIPLKLQPTNTPARITITGTGLREGVRVFLQGPGCTLWPPTFCDRDFVLCFDVEIAPDGNSMTAEVPIGLEGDWRVVVEDPAWLTVGGAQWHAGPMLNFTPPTWPRLHGFAFKNEDDHPSMEEFEACYGDSIFLQPPFPVPLRNPHYALWAIIYGAWMEGAKGSCFGMASTARLLANGDLSVTDFDTPAADGFHGVLYANGFLGHPTNDLSAPKPARWTGFDLFQATRPVNLWSRITSFAAAQTSAEGMLNLIRQIRPPIPFGAGRGLAAGNPNAVLDRVRANPHLHMLCIYQRDWGKGHCVAPYAVVDNMGLTPDGLGLTTASNRSIIKVYDNNRPDRECFIEVNRGNNTFRYNPEDGALADPEADEYLGPGLFSTPISLFTNPRHAPDPHFLAEHGLSALRLLIVGAATASVTNAAGATAGWTTNGLVVDYPEVLPYRPVGYIPGTSERFDDTMLFLPVTNPPAGGMFTSAGSNMLLHAASGWNDIAFGFNAPSTGLGNSVYGILIGLNQALQGLGVRAAASVQGFSAMTSTRQESGACRVWVLDAGAGPATPDLHIELEGFEGIKLRNFSAQPLNLRFNLSGADPTPDQTFRGFEFASDAVTLPGLAALRLRPSPGHTGFHRELDTDSDGTPELVDEVPARGALRASREGGLLALRWRQAAFQETLETSEEVNHPAWNAADVAIVNEGLDRVARLGMEAPMEFFRLRFPETDCFGFGDVGLGPKPNPWETEAFKFEAFNAAGAMQPHNTFVNRDGSTGLDVAHTVRIHPHYDCQVLHIDVRQTSGLVRFEAVGALGTIVSRAELVGPGTGTQRVTLRTFGGRIHYVRVISPNALCLIESLCWERTAQQPEPPYQSTCVNFENMPPDFLNSPAMFAVGEFNTTMGPLAIQAVPGQGVNGLKLAGTTTVNFMVIPPGTYERVTIRVFDPLGGTLIQAMDPSMTFVRDEATTTGTSAPQSFTMNGPGIGRLHIISSHENGYLLEICGQR